MPSLGDRVASLRQRARNRTVVKRDDVERKRQSMRESMPKVAALVDDVRLHFGDDVKVLAANENGHKVINTKALRLLGMTHEDITR